MNSGIQKTDGLSKLQHQEPPDNTHGGFLGISSGFLTKPPGNLQEPPQDTLVVKTGNSNLLGYSFRKQGVS